MHLLLNVILTMYSFGMHSMRLKVRSVSAMYARGTIRVDEILKFMSVIPARFEDKISGILKNVLRYAACDCLFMQFSSSLLCFQTFI